MLTPEGKGFLLDALASGNNVTFAPVAAAEPRRKVAMRLVGLGLCVLLQQRIPDPYHRYFQLTDRGLEVAQALDREKTRVLRGGLN